MESLASRRSITGAEDIVAVFGEWYTALPNEVPLALWLNNKHVLDGYHIISEGTATASLVHVGDVYRALLLGGAVTWIFVHNHPSGDPTPSREDVVIVNSLQEAGRLLGVPLLDAVIIGTNGRSYSFAAKGRL